MRRITLLITVVAVVFVCATQCRKKDNGERCLLTLELSDLRQKHIFNARVYCYDQKSIIAMTASITPEMLQVGSYSMEIPRQVVQVYIWCNITANTPDFLLSGNDSDFDKMYYEGFPIDATGKDIYHNCKVTKEYCQVHMTVKGEEKEYSLWLREYTLGWRPNKTAEIHPWERYMKPLSANYFQFNLIRQSNPMALSAQLNENGKPVMSIPLGSILAEKGVDLSFKSDNPLPDVHLEVDVAQSGLAIEIAPWENNIEDKTL